MKKILSYFVIIILAFAVAISYEVFVIPNSFAPAGVNGVCVIFMKLSGFNIGYLSMILNIPLALIVFLKINRSVAVRSIVYVLSFSVALIILDKLNFSYKYLTENGTSRILGPLTAGIIMGCVYSVLVRAGAYTGGTDFISLLINNNHPEKSVFYINFFINTVVAASSFFVFDYKIEPVLLSVLYSFSSTIMADRAMRTGKSAIRFEIITSNADEITEDIIKTLHHSATIINTKGAFSGESKKMIVCIINRTQLARFYMILNNYPNTFAVMDPVSEVFGNFKHLSQNGRIETDFLDNAIIRK